nr:MAG TPA: hypothetical protein [Caudoviricetes sp.]
MASLPQLYDLFLVKLKHNPFYKLFYVFYS